MPKIFSDEYIAIARTIKTQNLYFFKKLIIIYTSEFLIHCSVLLRDSRVDRNSELNREHL